MIRWLMIIVGSVRIAAAIDDLRAQENSTPAAAPADQQPLVDLPVEMEAQPYRVRILMADEARDTDLQTEVPLALARSIGSLWETHVGELTNHSHCDGAALRRWQVSNMPQRFPTEDAAPVDFWYAVTVNRHGSRRTVAVRAWQPQFEWLSPVHEESCFEPREIPGRIVKSCWRLFRPQVFVEHVADAACRLRIPGGDLQPADPAYQLLQPGDCLIPWLMYYDRNKALKKKQELPWTYIRFDERQGALAQGTVLSGLRSPLGGKSRGRIDKVAVVSRAVYPETRLEVGVQDQPARSLAGYRLELRPKLPEKNVEPEADSAEKTPSDQSNEPEQSAEQETVVKLLTNRLGEARLIPNPQQQSVWIYVYSGDLLLARVPFVPGSLAFLRLDVPDDSIRLQVEGELQTLQSELINVVAERNTLIATARSTSRKGDWQRVEVLRKQLDGLPSKQAFQERLGAIRVPAVNAAKARKDRAGQVRIERLCKDVDELMDRYLHADRLKQVQEELDLLIKDAKANETP